MSCDIVLLLKLDFVMRKIDNLYENISVESIRGAAIHAFKGHSHKREIKKFKKDFDKNCEMLFEDLVTCNWEKHISYRSLVKVNKNGKIRHIESPSLKTRIYQHLLLDILTPVYTKKDNRNGLNCKKKCGLNSNFKNGSLLHKIKAIFYDRLDLNYYFLIDQRKCYEHILEKTFRKQLKKIVSDKRLIDYAVRICFVNGKLPIGTPTSPLVHHIVMLSFDYFIKDIAPACIRYADDNLVFARTKQEANSLKWRIKNYWWYELGIRSKRQTGTIYPIHRKCDFCGFIFNSNRKGKNKHNKGFVIGRKRIVKNALKSNKKNYPSYFGILKNTDQYNLLTYIEKKMKLSELTSKIRIDRKMDADNISIKDLKDIIFNIYDYEIRCDASGQPNWIKCLIGIKEIRKGKPTGKMLAREFHGNYSSIIQFLYKCEKEVGRENFLPLECVEIEDRCGYVFRDSTNLIDYINENEY